MDFFNFLKEKKFVFLMISIIFNILLGITSGILLYQSKTQEYSNEIICEETSDSEVEIEKFYVEIKGAVNNPGVYEASRENIINDIVELAGGFTKSAYTNNINLSRKVSNELVIYVYTTSEYKKVNTTTKIVQQTCDCSSYDISNCTNNKQSEIVANNNDTNFNEENNNSNNTTSSSDTNITTKININTATTTELTKLSGIGESKAKDIVAYRETNGNFKSIEEIKNVSGIGNAIFEKIKDSITV